MSQGKVILTNGKTILVADDEAIVLNITCNLLSKLGYEVIAAHNGEEVIELFKAEGEGIDLLLLDIMMPKMSGPAAAHEIRQMCPDIPLLFCTGYSDDKTRGELSVIEGYELIRKPLRIPQLVTAIGNFLGAPG